MPAVADFNRLDPRLLKLQPAISCSACSTGLLRRDEDGYPYCSSVMLANVFRV